MLERVDTNKSQLLVIANTKKCYPNIIRFTISCNIWILTNEQSMVKGDTNMSNKKIVCLRKEGEKTVSET